MSAGDLQSSYYRGRERARGAGLRLESYWQHAGGLSRDGEGGAEHACARGCTFCCHFPVGVRRLECERIAGELRGAGAEFRERIRAEARRRERLGWEAVAAQRSPCPLLDTNGSCRVHGVRPLACRGWNSFDRSSCEREFQGVPGARIELDGSLHVATLGLADALGDSLGRAGADPACYELVSALDHLLEDPEAQLSSVALRVGEWGRG